MKSKLGEFRQELQFLSYKEIDLVTGTIRNYLAQFEDGSDLENCSKYLAVEYMISTGWNGMTSSIRKYDEIKDFISKHPLTKKFALREYDYEQTNSIEEYIVHFLPSGSPEALALDLKNQFLAEHCYLYLFQSTNTEQSSNAGAIFVRPRPRIPRGPVTLG